MNEPWFVRTILLKFKLVYSHVSTNRGVHTFFSKMKKKKKFFNRNREWYHYLEHLKHPDNTESGTTTLCTYLKYPVYVDMS